MLPTDIALKEDPEFRKTAELYAADQSAFFDDFAKAYGKLLSSGCPEQCQPGCCKEDPVTDVEVYSAEFREHAMHGSIEHCKTAVEKGADVHALEYCSNR